jgi:hypothetical protein
MGFEDKIKELLDKRELAKLGGVRNVLMHN